MHIVRFADPTGSIHVGVRDEDGTHRIHGVRRIADLLRMPLAQLRGLVETARDEPVEPGGTLLPPVDGHTEVWAGGVTYARSKDARMEESTEESVYDRVYRAPRPELFFKALPWRVVTDGESVAVRADSPLNVPEPELTVVANSEREIVGYGVCNDVSSRTIEGENPLYLPQAKVYAGSCALAPGIRPAWEVPDHRRLDITMRVDRGGSTEYQDTVSTSALQRELDELVEYLFLGQPFPDGVVLATGTGIVPAMEFTLLAGDVVRITVDGVGELTNPVVDDAAALDWLVAAIDQPLSREKPSRKKEQ